MPPLLNYCCRCCSFKTFILQMHHHRSETSAQRSSQCSEESSGEGRGEWGKAPIGINIIRGILKVTLSLEHQVRVCRLEE
ncbi:hypothetical protein ABVT39_005383 [Epinephelus coioides]